MDKLELEALRFALDLLESALAPGTETVERSFSSAARMNRCADWLEQIIEPLDINVEVERLKRLNDRDRNDHLVVVRYIR